jgi:hypothetical protein
VTAMVRPRGRPDYPRLARFIPLVGDIVEDLRDRSVDQDLADQECTRQDCQFLHPLAAAPRLYGEHPVRNTDNGAQRRATKDRTAKWSLGRHVPQIGSAPVASRSAPAHAEAATSPAPVDTRRRRRRDPFLRSACRAPMNSSLCASRPYGQSTPQVGAPMGSAGASTALEVVKEHSTFPTATAPESMAVLGLSPSPVSRLATHRVQRRRRCRRRRHGAIARTNQYGQQAGS